MVGGLVGQGRDVQAAKGHVAATPAIVIGELVGAVREGGVDRHHHQVRSVVGGERHDVLVLEHDPVVGVEIRPRRCRVRATCSDVSVGGAAPGAGT
jgi:hypothetical protein